MLRDTPEVRWGALLVLLLVAILLEPVFGASRPVELLGLALLQFVVVRALFTSVTDRRGRIAGLALALFWFGATLFAIFVDALHGVVAAVSVLMLAGALYVTFRNLLDREAGDLEALVGAVFGYVLLAMAWAMFFVQIERWQPGAISFPDDAPLWSSSVYYSLVTLTSLGYGDILPVHPLARVMSGLEAVVGVLYIAVMIGSIVGSYRGRRYDK
ncbi:ion channel [Aliiruegeria haliotis]|uniref:Ion channel n=1 Tax=Aliiruegeria haliotis TaxID=1280846 RepID=A0A2T0S0V6_9RHOB|nr:potassium channel family protein [Aliiruegeria haliotis]PRY26933.1 ion channel [Aliiruegeria haliotis]